MVSEHLMSSSIELILDELRAARAQIDSLVRDVADLKAQDKQLVRNVEQFWAENWSPLKADIQDIKNRLFQLEQRDIQELERRLDRVESESKILLSAELAKRVQQLEKSEARKQGFAAAAGALGGGGVAALFKWLAGS